MIRPQPNLLVLIVAAAALAGCAGDQPGTRDVGSGRFGQGGGDAAPARRGLPNLFISPAGKPYRAEPGAPYPSAVWFAAADTDHDGKLSQEEFRKDAEAFFRELDTNHDGVIDGFEVQAYEQTDAPEILPRLEGLAAGEGTDVSLGKNRGNGAEIGVSRTGRGGPIAAGDQRPLGAGLYGFLNEPEPVAAADTSFSSRMTLADFRAAADRRFAALDVKKLGYLSLTDLPKTPVQIALERAAQRAAMAKP